MEELLNFETKEKCCSCKKEIPEPELNFSFGNPSEVFCDDCKFKLLEEKELKENEIIRYKKYKRDTFFTNYKKFTEKILGMESYNKIMDISNKFLILEQDQIRYGNAWPLEEISPLDTLMICSFVGPSGSGKSSIIGQICTPDQHPIPGETNSTKSTSSDLNAFIGNTFGKDKYLILDSEGFGGTKSTTMDHNKSNKNRSEYVQIAYPRLLYQCSDVFVFTFSGDGRNKKDIFDPLNMYSKISSSCTNNLVTPHLIILLNNSNYDEKFDDSEFAETEYFSNQDSIYVDLKSKFKSVSLIFIPISQISYSRYVNQIKRLNEMISDKLIDSIRSKEKYIKKDKYHTMQRITNLINFLNKDPNGIPNLLTIYGSNELLPSIVQKSSGIAPCGIDQIVIKCADYLVAFFKNLYDYHTITLSLGPIKSFDDCMNIIKSRLHDIKNKFGERYYSQFGFDCKQLDKNFESLLENASKRISDLTPCIERDGHGKQCTVVKKCHNQCKHKSKSIKESQSTGVSLGGGNKVYILNEWPANGNGIFKASNIYENLFQYFISTFKENCKFTSQFSLPIEFNMDVCFGCCIDSPSVPYKCRHLLCFNCSNNKDKCPIENCAGDIYFKPKKIDLFADIGARILTLDGGGIRGIIEGNALELIKDQMYGMEIYNIFDLIIGASAGGLIALSIVSPKNNENPTTIVDTVINFGKKGFSSRILGWIKGNLTMIFQTKYTSKALEECISQELRNQPLIDTFSKIRVAVTACSRETGDNETILFSNYFKQKINCYSKINYIVNSDVFSAALSTSATPTYFPPFIFNDRELYDGGLKNNNPCEDAYKECDHLWPNKKIDIFVSIGTGEHIKTQSSDMFSSKLKLDWKKSVMGSEKMWEKLLEDKTKLNDKNSFRYNPKLRSDIGFDDIGIDSIEKLKSLKEQTDLSGTICLIANKSLASLFFANGMVYRDNILYGKIECRVPNSELPVEIKDQLLIPNMFIINLKNAKLEYSPPTREDLLIKENFFIVDFQINDPKVPEIDILCTLLSRSRVLNRSSISSSPYKLIL